MEQTKAEALGSSHSVFKGFSEGGTVDDPELSDEDGCAVGHHGSAFFKLLDTDLLYLKKGDRLPILQNLMQNHKPIL